MAQDIDKQITWEDAVSIAFLIVDKQEVGLTLCRKMASLKRNWISTDDDSNGKGCGIMQLIYHSLENNGSSTWPPIVFRTLYLVGQKRILFELGLDVEREVRVLEEGHKIKPERRLLYNLIENMESAEHDRLSRVLQDSGCLSRLEGTVETMEVLLFHLLGERRIEDLCQLMVESFRTMNRADLENFYTSQQCGSTVCPVHRKRGDTNPYYEQGEGLCVIINQKLFKEGSMLDNRLGTDRWDRNVISQKDQLPVTSETGRS